MFLESDIVVLVTGLVGSGRSTFINALLSEESSGAMMRVDDTGSLDTCTTKVEHTIIDLKVSPLPSKDYRLVLVDTPGFNDSEKSDATVLQEISGWLETSFPGGRCRAGIIYLHDISADRYQGLAESDLQALDSSLNSDASKQLIIATSKWNCVSSPIEGERRHKLLEERWKSLSARSTVYKFKGIGDAWGIIGAFLPEIERGTRLEVGRELAQIKDARYRADRVQGSRRHGFRTLGQLLSRLF